MIGLFRGLLVYAVFSLSIAVVALPPAAIAGEAKQSRDVTRSTPGVSACGDIERVGFNLAKSVQRVLKNAGYAVGKVDGIVGPRTRAAIQAWQRDRGVCVDGEIRHETLREMGLVEE